MVEILTFIQYILGLYLWIIIASVILSWLVAFNVINPYNNFVRSLMMGFDAVTQPFLGPIRRLLPRTAGIDFSPIILIIGVIFIRDYLIGHCGFGIIMRQLC